MFFNFKNGNLLKIHRRVVKGLNIYWKVEKSFKKFSFEFKHEYKTPVKLLIDTPKNFF